MLILLLGACGAGGMGAGLGQPTCKESTDYEWDWSPVRFVIAADDDGSFDVSTGWDDYPVITGSWGEESLAYEEHAEPSDENWVASSDAVGTLDVMDGGDYRVDYERTLVDVNDEETTSTLQAARTGCVEATRVIYDDVQVDQTATYDADGADVEANAVWADAFKEWESRYGQDGSYTEDSIFTDSDGEETVHTEGNWNNGHDIDEYSGAASDYTYEGVNEHFLDGSLDHVFTGRKEDGYWWKYDDSYDYDGNGSGRFTSSIGSDCELTYVEWERTCDCVEGTGPCD